MTKRLAVIVALGFVAVGWACWRSVPAGARASAVERAQARGFDALLGQTPRELATWTGRQVTARMATCKITSIPFSMEFDFWLRTSNGSDQANTVQVAFGNVSMSYLRTEGGYHYFLTDNLDPGDAFAWRYPSTGSGVQSGGLHYVSNSDECYIQMEASSNPIGEKAQTHAKEGICTDTWRDVPGATSTVTVTNLGDGELGHFTGPGGSFVGETSHSITVSGNLTTVGFSAVCDPDDWGDLQTAGAYPVEFSGIKFCGNAVNFGATYPAQAWYTGGGATLWEKGVGNAVYLYGDTVGGPQPGWSGVTLSPPYSHDFSNLHIRDWQGNDLDPIVYVACLRRIVDLQDVGDWSGTISELRALGRVTQTRGWHTKDTADPDVTGDVRLWMRRSSAQACGIEVGLPDYTLSLVGAGWGAVKDEEGNVTTPSPLDGGYAEDGTYGGQPLYRHELGYCLYWHDGDNGYAIAKAPGGQRLYQQADGGPTGIYGIGDVPNTPIDPETGQGPLEPWPAVSEQAGAPVIAGAPSFAHDLLFVFDGHTVAATSRTESPYITDVFTLNHLTARGIYADALTHESWTAISATVPDVDGDFTVTAPNGYLTLTLPSNYEARQAAVPGMGGATAVPEAYHRKAHDANFGNGTCDANHEAVYNWLGWGYCQFGVRDYPVGGKVTVTIEYHFDLDGIGDNHLSDSTRQTGYTYAAGDLQTLTREITVRYKRKDGWVPLLVDILDKDLPELALVQTIKLTFDTAGDYRISEPSLTNDPGDPQEPGDFPTFGPVGSRHYGAGLYGGGPLYKKQIGRPAPKGNGCLWKRLDAWRYAHGGISGHYNGAHVNALVYPDWVKGNAREHTVGELVVVEGAGTGGDMTTARSLAALEGDINAWAGDAWVAAYSSTAEAACMEDGDGTALRTLAAYDVVPTMGSPEGAVTVANRVGKWVAVNGLPYTWYGTHWVKSRLHGTAWQVNTDYRARGSGNVCIVRTTDTEHAPILWEGDQSDISADEHGHWESRCVDPKRYAPRPVKQWLYGASDQTEAAPHVIGYAPTREWAAQDVVVTPLGKCWMSKDPGRSPQWVACESNGGIKAYRFRENGGGLEPLAAAPFAATTYKLASIQAQPDGSLLCAATNTAETRIDVAQSRDGGETWVVDVAIGDGLKWGTLGPSMNGTQYLAGYKSGKVYIRGTSAPDLAADTIDGTNTEVEVCSLSLTPGLGTPIISTSWAEDGRLLVSVALGANTTWYATSDISQGFTQVT